MILVTGGTGFLGSTLIHILIDKGEYVMATKRPTSIVPDQLLNSPLVTWVDADITDYFALSDIFPQVTKVYHCAAKISYQKEDAAEMHRINIQGTQHVVNLCLEHGLRLVHVSSIAALGSNKTGQPISEEDKWEYDRHLPNYSLSKYKSELEVWRGIREGLSAVIVNPSVIMGPAAGKKGSGVIFELVNKGINIYPSGSVGIVDVEDVANIMLTLMEDASISGQRYILNSENISHKDLLERIASLLNKKAPTVEAKPYMMSIGWRVATLLAIITRSRSTLTKESSRAASEKLAYSNQKIRSAINYSFKPVNQTLEEIANTNYK